MLLHYRLLLLSCLLGVALGMQLLGANRCTWGPSWWCLNETTASDCGATQHCIEHVWKTPIKKQPSAMENFLKNPIGLLPVGIKTQTQSSVSATEDTCDTCIDRVLEIKILTKDDSASEGFEQLLVKECVKWYNSADYCYEIVSHTGDAIFSLIKRSSPEQVCDLVLQCGNVCNQCKTDAVVVEEALAQNLTDQEILDLSLDFCAKLGPYSGACKSAITSRMDIVVEDLVSFLQNEPCVNLGACESSLQLVSSETECELCEFLMEYIVHVVSENSTEQEVITLLDKVCDLFQKSSQICRNLVNANIRDIIQLLLEKESPHTICSQINVCNSSSISALSPLPKQTGAALLCSAVASIFQSLFSTDLIVRAIVQVFYLTCNILPDETAVENCQSFVMLYIAGILQIMNAALPISYLCVAFLGNNVNAISNINAEPLVFSPAVRSAVECSICELVLDVVRMNIDSKKSVKEIEEDFNIVCQVFPEGNLKQDCESAVYLVPVVLDLLEHNINPKEICYFVSACPNDSSLGGTAVVKHDTQQVDSFDLACFACKSGVTMAFSLLASNHTLQELINMINGLCLIINPDSGCESYLEELLPSVLKYIQGQFSADDVCIGVGWCQNDEVGGYTTDKNAPIEQTEEMGCLLCSAFTTLLDDYTGAYSESTILAIADELCNQFGELSEECKSVVENQLPTIIEKLRAGESPKQLCAEFKCCQAAMTRVSASLLGGDGMGEYENECQTCLEAIVSIKSMLASEGEDYTEKYLMKQCIAAYSETTCSQAVSHLIKMVQSGDDPSYICSKLELCSIEPEIESTMDCDTCMKYGNEIEERITENMTSSEFKQVLLDLCDVNSNIQNCKSFVNFYYLKLYEFMITEGKSFMEICKEAGYCSVSMNSANSPEVSSYTKYCTECKFILSLTKRAFSRLSEDDIKEKVSAMCTMVAEDQYDKCTELFDSFLSYLYNILTGDMSVSELCEEINACSSEVTLQKTYLQLWEQLQQSPSSDCVLCTWMSQSIHPQLIDLYPHNFLKSKLSSKCSHLPTHDQASCEMLVENDYFISNLKSTTKDSPVCQTINICEGRARSPSGFSLFI